MKSILDKVEWAYNPVFSLGCSNENAWNDARLGLRAKGVLAYMQSKPRNWNFSSERISEESSDGRRVVLNCLNELIGLGYISRQKHGDGRVHYKLSEEAYVGIEPKIDKSPFDKLEVNMEHNSMYDGNTDYRNADGSVATLGEAVPNPYDGECSEFICTNDAIEELISCGWGRKEAHKCCVEWTKACCEAEISQSRNIWKAWKTHYRH